MDHENRKHFIVTKHKKNIFEIADEVYGDGGMAGMILKENPGVFQLKAGMVLNLPENVPQKPETADQAVRLDFACLKDFRRGDTAQKIEPENNSGISRQKEKIARELFDFLKEFEFYTLAGKRLREIPASEQIRQIESEEWI
jgi:hypothetical protein